MKDINGEEFSLERYRGKVMLIVNVASKCGFTPQHDGLEAGFVAYQELRVAYSVFSIYINMLISVILVFVFPGVRNKVNFQISFNGKHCHYKL